LHPLEYTKPNEFTIEEHDEDDKFAVPEADKKEYIRDYPRVYDIVFVKEGIYKYILAIQIIRTVSDTAPTGSTYATRIRP
jgi:hypothetical protein